MTFRFLHSSISHTNLLYFLSDLVIYLRSLDIRDLGFCWVLSTFYT
jgi:hypothetical protein